MGLWAGFRDPFLPVKCVNPVLGAVDGAREATE